MLLQFIINHATLFIIILLANSVLLVSIHSHSHSHNKEREEDGAYSPRIYDPSKKTESELIHEVMLGEYHLE